VRWETEQSFDGKLCQKYLYQKLLKYGNWFSSYSRKCRECFLGHSVLRFRHIFYVQLRVRLELGRVLTCDVIFGKRTFSLGTFYLVIRHRRDDRFFITKFNPTVKPLKQ